MCDCDLPRRGAAVSTSTELSRRAVLGAALGVGLAASTLHVSPVKARVSTWSAPQRWRGVEPPPVQPRDTWAVDRPPKGPMPAETVQFLLVHHTAGPNEYQPEDVPRLIRDVYDFHTGPDKGWPDVAYNFFVDRFGGLWEGRAGSLAGPVQADATGGSQGFAQLVCVLGDFTSVMPTDAALGSATDLLAWLADRYAVDTNAGSTTSFVSRGSNKWPMGDTVVVPTISGHREVSATECPGNTFYPFVRDDLQAAVTAVRLAATPPSTVPTTAPTTVAITAAPSTSPASSAAPIPAAPTVVDATSATAATEGAADTGDSGDGNTLVAGALVIGAAGAVAAGVAAMRRRA